MTSQPLPQTAPPSLPDKKVPPLSGCKQATAGLVLGTLGLFSAIMMIGTLQSFHHSSPGIEEAIGVMVMTVIVVVATGITAVASCAVGMMASGVACCRPDTRLVGAFGILLNAVPVALCAAMLWKM